MKDKSYTLDIIASTTSLCCAIHCLSVPLVLSFSSLNSLHFLENQYIECFFIFLGLSFVIVSLWPCYNKNHRKTKPLIFATLGFVLIGIGKFEFTEIWEISTTVIGASLVSLAHYLNWNILKKLT